MKLLNQTGCFENLSSKTVVIVKNGIVLSRLVFGKTPQALADMSISKSSQWETTNEYVFIPRDDQKGWYQPGTGLRHKSGIDYMSISERSKMISIEQYLKSC